MINAINEELNLDESDNDEFDKYGEDQDFILMFFFNFMDLIVHDQSIALMCSKSKKPQAYE